MNSGKKSVPFLVKTFFFGLHLICSPEQNRGRGSSPPMLKIGRNWGKIANYPPMLNKDLYPCSTLSRKKTVLRKDRMQNQWGVFKVIASLVIIFIDSLDVDNNVDAIRRQHHN